MARNKRSSKAGRDSGGFLALPYAVLNSPAYLALSDHAKVLLIDVAQQLRGDNNGALLCSRAYMAQRGWTSSDMLTKCKRELLAAGLLHETVIGQRPNRASWYAVTWMALDKLRGFDPGAAETFKRSAYKEPPRASVKPSRDELYAKWGKVEPGSTLPDSVPPKNESLVPSHGTAALG